MAFFLSNIAVPSVLTRVWPGHATRTGRAARKYPLRTAPWWRHPVLADTQGQTPVSALLKGSRGGDPDGQAQGPAPTTGGRPRGAAPTPTPIRAAAPSTQAGRHPRKRHPASCSPDAPRDARPPGTSIRTTLGIFPCYPPIL